MAVTIQAVHVNSKQMTLAVFRQLPRTSLVLDRGERDERLRWWGLVRYPIKEEADVWMVADRDGVLYRAPIQPAHRYVVQLARQIGDYQAALAVAARGSFVDYKQKRYLRADIERSISTLSEDYELWKLKGITFAQAVRMPQLFIAV